MEFAEELRSRKGAIQENWVGKILDSYPPRSRAFFGSQRDEFLNPVGTVLSSRAGAILDSLLEGFDLERLNGLLEDVIRIRAVQDFSASQALAFLPLLKQSLREEAVPWENEGECLREIEKLEARIDRMMLLAFDIYAGCRQRIYELRIAELKRLQSLPQERRAARRRLRDLEHGSDETGGCQ